MDGGEHKWAHDTCIDQFRVLISCQESNHVREEERSECDGCNYRMTEMMHSYMTPAPMLYAGDI